ncbi:sodium:calcium antiporter [Tautonia sociabilis]|uniref:Sodium:calcium antiporter n=1 Tax=Tautonia sociabilis TaxID=2080755 RepID=A0A432MQG4_9BACT|nr:sodium:calcium antiporter [Tautonia sociabilis]RUL89489.1 sodium:calcium antiporter [Tautonia sociabilis]
MIVSIVLLLACAAVIYASCELFVNGVEWLGRRLNVGETATGTLLAAFGTALPESAVTFVAVIFGATAAQKEMGVGAAIGGPLVLATISYAVVGLVLLVSARKLNRRDAVIITEQRRLSRDQGWFLSIFIFKIALGLVAFEGKRWLGLLFLAAYAAYVWKEMTHRGDNSEEELEPLTFSRRSSNPPLGIILLQTLGALTLMGIASHYFVHEMGAIGPWLGLSPQLVALLISPIATELPETMNAVIWVRQGKEKLALANISGAMMIQATVPSALGLLFTPWLLDTPLIVAAVATAAAVGMLYLGFRHSHVSAWALIPNALVYGIFAAGAWVLS